MTHDMRSIAATRTPQHAALSATLLAASTFVIASWITPAVPLQLVLWIKSLLMAPVVEEVFFRGVVQRGLRAHGGPLGRPWVAIAMTAVGFGLLHLGSAPAMHAALVVIPALALGWVFERTHSIPLCIALHSAANAFWLSLWSS
jgi:membrane protease YdiL (CAAX protease family)